MKRAVFETRLSRLELRRPVVQDPPSKAERDRRVANALTRGQPATLDEMLDNGTDQQRAALAAAFRADL